MVRYTRSHYQDWIACYHLTTWTFSSLHFVISFQVFLAWWQISRHIVLELELTRDQDFVLQAIDSADWSEVGVTSSHLSSGEWYGRASLENLAPNSQYMVQVASLNKEGYSKFSPVTFFTTLKQGNIPTELIDCKIQLFSSENFTKEAISTDPVTSSASRVKQATILMTLILSVLHGQFWFPFLHLTRA